MPAELGRLARSSGRLAIDTEFMSERRYQALLCLAQVAVPDPDAPDDVRTALIDPIEDPDLDPAPVAEALADPSVEIVVHAGRQDVAILRRTWKTDITNVFDTQVAAGFLGHGGQIGYAALVRKVLEYEVAGGEAFTRWDQRPLTDQQKEYALADAAHLLELGEILARQLDERGRLQWAREECAPVENSSDERDPDEVFRRIGNVDRLKPRARGIARGLVEWRDQAAREADRPPGSIVPDHALIELARRTPGSKTDLEAIRGLPQQTLHRRHRELIEAIAAAEGTEAPEVRRPPRRDGRDAPLVALCGAVVRQRSMDEKIAPEVIGTQSDTATLVSDVRGGREESSESRLLNGWRRELVGDELIELLRGRRMVGVNPEGGLKVDGAG